MPAEKISSELVAILCEALEKGHYREVACRLAGIDRKTLLNWLKRGAREKSGLYRELFHAVERARVIFKSCVSEESSN